ncbi:MAG: zf-HC2 domain-containing protein [Paludibaculum sp.]
MSNGMTVHMDEAQLLEFLDGELTAEQVGVVRAHLQECAECGQRLTELRATSGAFVEFERQSMGSPP